MDSIEKQKKGNNNSLPKRSSIQKVLDNFAKTVIILP